jgi:hypothetical protein
MSAAQKKIVIKSGAKTAQVSLPLTQKSPAAALVAAAPAATLLQQKKVVAPQKAVVKKAAPVAAAEESESEEEAPAKTRDELLMEALALLQAALGMSAGKRKGLKKDGTPRAKRTNNSGWQQFVKEFREENPGVSWKDAMVLCKADWKALKGEDASVASADEEESAPAAKAPKKKLVIAAKPVAPAKTAAQIVAEVKAAAAAAAAEAEPEVEVEEFEWEGQTLQKNAQGFCWRVDESGEQIFIGRWDAEEEKMDETAEEPTYGSA